MTTHRAATPLPPALAGLLVVFATACEPAPAPTPEATPQDRPETLWSALDVNLFGGAIASDASVVFWGSPSCPPSDAPPGEHDRPPDGQFARLALFGYNYAAVGTDGLLLLNSGDVWPTRTPLDDRPVRAVDVGVRHGCAVAEAGELSCWFEDFQEPFAWPAGNRFVEVGVTGWGAGPEANLLRACAVDTDGRIECFGHDPLEPWAPPAMGAHRSLSVASDWACALDFDDRIVCWGSVTSVRSPPAGTFSQVAIGEFTGCALDLDGYPTCWGEPSDPDGPTPGRTEPPQVPMEAISVASDYACGIETEGPIRCWGWSEWGSHIPPDEP